MKIVYGFQRVKKELNAASNDFKPEFLGERLSDLTAFLGIHTQF